MKDEENKGQIKEYPKDFQVAHHNIMQMRDIHP
jgi:hypothetical protein